MQSSCPANTGMKRPASPPGSPFRSPANDDLFVGAEEETPVAEGPRINYLGNPVVAYDESVPYTYLDHEAVPDVPFYHPDFKTILELLGNAVDTLIHAMRGCGNLDFEMDALINELDSKSVVAYGDTIKVGLLGDAGAGKSSFINAFLECPGLATTNDSGSSCTQVVTEYMDDPRADCPFHAEVKFKAKHSIRHDIRHHFKAYVRFGLGRDDDGAEERIWSSSGGLRDSNQAEVQTAETFFTQLFASDPRYGTPSALFKTMSASRPEHYEVAIEDLCVQSERLLEEVCTDAKERTLDIKTADIRGLPSILKQYTDTTDDTNTAFWPIIDSVKLRINSILLRQGFRIADCPGADDVNISRKNATSRFLRSCHVVVILGSCQRFVDNLNIDEYINNYTRHMDNSMVLLLPTKCEIAESNPGKGLFPEEKSQLEAAVKAASDATNAKNRCIRQTTQYGAARLLEQKKVAYATKLRSLFRSNIIIRHFQQKQQIPTRGKTVGSCNGVTVIPVSSKSQAMYVSGDARDDPMVLTPAEAGIATVRATICALAISGRLEAVIRHLGRSIPHTIQRFDMALTKCPEKRMKRLLSMIEAGRDSWTSNAGMHETAIREVFRETVSKKVVKSYDTAKSVWSLEVRKLVEEWKVKWPHASTLQAFARREGYFKPGSSVEPIDMSDAILKIARKDVLDILDTFWDDIRGVGEAITEEVIGTISLLQDELEREGDAGGLDMSSFWSSIRLQKDEFPYTVECRFKAFKDTLVEHYTNAMVSGEKNKFTTAMEHVWKDVLNPKKAEKFKPQSRNVTMARYELLFARVTNKHAGSPFPALHQYFQETFDSMMADFSVTLKELMATPFEQFTADLKLRFEHDPTKQYMSEEHRGKVKEVFDKARQEFNNSIWMAKIMAEGLERSHNEKHQRAKEAIHETLGAKRTRVS